MKIGVLATLGILIALLLLGACSYILSQKEKVTSQKEKIQEDTEGKVAVGPGGCVGDKCSKYCEENPIGCQDWCKQNPEPCKEMLEGTGHEFPTDPRFGINPQECLQNPKKCLEFCEKNPEICPEEHLKNLRSGMEGFIGPGGCTGPDCATVCSTQPEVCQEWCEKNPQICAMFMGGGFAGGAEATEPPKTTIKFAKTLSVFDSQSFNNDIIKAKELGANMITIWPARFIRNDEIIFFPERISQAINFAHQQGLQVELRNSYGEGEEPKNYKKFRENVLKHVAEYAKFAEKHKVYRIVPFGEIDNNMLNHQSKITELSKEMLAEIRKYYSGQIGIGVAAPWRDSGFTFNSYDYLTVSAYPHNDILTSVNWAREVADRSNIKILHIGETGVINPEDFTRSQQFFQTLKLSKEEEAEFYQQFFEQVSNKVNGISVFYNSVESFLSVYGDPAEKVVKEWYNKLYPEEKNQETKLIVANPINLSQVVRISKFRSCAGHDYSGLNTKGEKETLRSMKHYIEFFPQFLGSENTVKVFAPFNGKIVEIIEAGGKQVFISADAAPTWHFIFFHISPKPEIQEGATVKAGQLVGYAYVSKWPTFDFGLKEFSMRREIFESPFLHMQNSILEEYASYGVTPENIIVSKQYRDTYPCPVQGTRDGEEAFTGETEKNDFVILK